MLLLDNISRDRSRSIIKLKTILYTRHLRLAHLPKYVPGCPLPPVCAYNIIIDLLIPRCVCGLIWRQLTRYSRSVDENPSEYIILCKTVKYATAVYYICVHVYINIYIIDIAY